GVWIAPAEALARSERGGFPLVFATIRQLHDLAAFGSVQEALVSTTTQYVAPRIPILVQENGVTRVHLVGDEHNGWDVPAHMTKM
ncbi:MAG TPA: hypothetical protein VFK47_18270, partial [Ktedonobacteraceae bacterium]|nr:hypothetical protein [Ktedonobacteraceae bacterium]